MLTGKLVRVKNSRSKLLPSYIDVNDARLRETASHLLEIFRELKGKSRSEAEEEIREAVGDLPSQLIEQGLAKLLEDRCEFEVDAEIVPAEVREKVFLKAGTQRTQAGTFDRDAILKEVAEELEKPPEMIERALFADLRDEQRIVSFEDCTVEQLLNRYNVALAQAVLLKAIKVTVAIRGESQNRYRQLFKRMKFHRLICDIRAIGPVAYELRLDGPLSLFSSTQKYGIQLANFLPWILQCKHFELRADIRWSADRKEKQFFLDNKDSLQSYTVDYGNFTSPEVEQFAISFQKSNRDWEITTEVQILQLKTFFWTPDFQLTHKKTGEIVYFELFGFWRKTDVEKYYERLKQEFDGPFLLAASDQMNIEENTEADLNPNIYRYKRTPLPGEVAKLADRLIGKGK